MPGLCSSVRVYRLLWFAVQTITHLVSSKFHLKSAVKEQGFLTQCHSADPSRDLFHQRLEAFPSTLAATLFLFLILGYIFDLPSAHLHHLTTAFRDLSRPAIASLHGGMLARIAKTDQMKQKLRLDNSGNNTTVMGRNR